MGAVPTLVGENVAGAWTPVCKLRLSASATFIEVSGLTADLYEIQLFWKLAGADVVRLHFNDLATASHGERLASHNGTSTATAQTTTSSAGVRLESEQGGAQANAMHGWARVYMGNPSLDGGFYGLQSVSSGIIEDTANAPHGFQNGSNLASTDRLTSITFRTVSGAAFAAGTALAIASLNV